jgi:membrane associated rhomboid family serine protease
MIPLTVDVPMKRLPWANWALILVTVVIGLAVPSRSKESISVLSPKEGQEPGDAGSLRVRVTTPEYSPLVLQRAHFAAYQLVTSLFLHAGPIHLLGNMLFLFVFGNAVNAKLGHVGFLGCYFGIGVLESLVWLLVGPGDATLGASAAIMGLCGMFLVLYPRNGVRVFWDEYPLAVVSRSWTGEVPGWALVLLYVAFDVWGAIFARESNIGYLSHITGAVAGIALAVVLLMGQWVTPDRGEQTLLQWLAGEGPTDEEEPPRPKAEKKQRRAPPGERTRR